MTTETKRTGGRELAARRSGRGKAAKKAGEGAGPLGFEAKLWQAADALRNNMDAAEYKHVVLGLIFLEYISDAFEAKRAEVAAEQAMRADPEGADEYRAASIALIQLETKTQVAKRDALLPKLTSGEMRITDSVRFAGVGCS